MTSPLPELINHVVTGSPVESIYDYVLDGTKIGWYPERIKAWQRGEKIAPITMDVAWTRRCNAACSFCYAQLQASDEGGEITKDIAFGFLEDAAEIGVKGISLISDGESTVVPWYEDSIVHAGKLGIKIGISTNGVRLKRRVLEKILPHTSYLRFNFSAGELQRYKEIMGLKERDYWQVIQNVKDAMDIVRRDKLSCNVNMQMVLDPRDADQILPFVKLSAEVRPTYCIIKHCSDSDEQALGVDYKKYQDLGAVFDEAESYGDAEFRVVIKRDRMKDEGKRKYSRCLGPAFQLQMSGNGLVSSCGFNFNSRFRKFHIGWIAGPHAQRFKTIWESDRYWEVLGYLGSDAFDPRRSCGTMCLQHHTNDFLFRLQNGQVELPTTPAPPQLEFL